MQKGSVLAAGVKIRGDLGLGLHDGPRYDILLSRLSKARLSILAGASLGAIGSVWFLLRLGCHLNNNKRLKG